MTDVFFYGDIHGNVDVLGRNINKNDNPEALHIQVGDFGFGFFDMTDLDDLEAISEKYKHRFMFIRGNHGSPEYIKKHPNYINDGRIEIIDGKKFMFVGGAFSIDATWRIPGKSWWFDEELSYEECEKMIEIYEKEKPDVMVTHDCPSTVSYQMFVLNNLANFRPDIKSRTQSMFDMMFNIHKPEQWFFGHWHHTIDMNIKGTKFQCIGCDTSILMEK